MQDFELELAGAHVMRVQICSKSLLKEETYAHGKIRVCAVSPVFTTCSIHCSPVYRAPVVCYTKPLASLPGLLLTINGTDSIKMVQFC